MWSRGSDVVIVGDILKVVLPAKLVARNYMIVTQSLAVVNVLRTVFGSNVRKTGVAIMILRTKGYYI